MQKRERATAFLARWINGGVAVFLATQHSATQPRTPRNKHRCDAAGAWDASQDGGQRRLDGESCTAEPGPDSAGPIETEIAGAGYGKDICAGSRWSYFLGSAALDVYLWCFLSARAGDRPVLPRLASDAATACFPCRSIDSPARSSLAPHGEYHAYKRQGMGWQQKSAQAESSSLQQVVQ